MHWNNSDRVFQIFQVIFTLVIFDSKPVELKYVSSPHFPSLPHMEALILWEPLPKSTTERADANVIGRQTKALSFGNERRHVVVKSPETWELSI